MKILVITNHSYMYWRFRRELTEYLLKDNEVLLSTPYVGHEEDLKALGCRCIETEVDRRGINPVTDSKLFLTYWKLLKAEKPDLVVTYSIKPNIYAGFACRMQKIPYCANVQGLGTAFQRKTMAKLVTILYKTALKKAKTTFFENEANAQVFRDRKIQKADRQTILHGAGINLEQYAYAPYPDNDRMHFLYLGRIMKEKGMDELFSACQRLKKEGVDFVLDLVGFYEDSYKDQVEALEAQGIVKFHDFQPEPRPYYAAADCVVLPSYHEGMSNVLLEASATGRPIITSDIPGCREAVQEGKSGFLCRAQDTGSLYAAMKSMTQRSKSQREAMGKAGRMYMEANFDKNAVVEMTAKAILK